MLFRLLAGLHAPETRAFAGEMVAFNAARLERARRDGRRLGFWIELLVDSVASVARGWIDHVRKGRGGMGLREIGRVAVHESGLRFLKRRKAAAALVVVTVALALAAANVSFAVLDAFMLSSFGIPDVERVVAVFPSREVEGFGSVTFAEAYPNYRLLRETTRSFEAVSAIVPGTFSWDDGEVSRALSGARVTASFFATTGVAPILGRGFATDEEGPSAARVAVISHALWQGAFSADPDVVGRVMLLDGAAHEIVGVMPAGFERPLPSEVWLPFDLDPTHWERILAARTITVYGRLAAGVTMREAQAEMRAFTDRALEASADNRGFSYGLLKLREQELPQGDRAALFVQGGSLVLLLLAVLNLTVVLIAWGVDRRQETSVRLALGAGGARVTLGLLFQGVILVGASSLGGLALTVLAIPAVRGLEVPPGLAPYLAMVGLDGRVFAFGASITLVAASVASLGPAWLGRRMALGETLRAGGRGSGLGPAAVRVQQALLALQATFTVVLLAGATSLGLSFNNLAEVSTGFASEGRLVSRAQLPADGYGTHAARAELGQRLEEALRGQPEIARAGFTSTLPLGDVNSVARFVATPAEADPALDPPASNLRRISSDYMSAMGIALVAGRGFDPRDDASGAPVAIVSQAAAERLWPGEDPIGRPLYRLVPGGAPLSLEVVGVAADLVEIRFDLPAAQTVYLPWAQASAQRLSVVFEPRGSAAEASAAFRRALRSAAPGLAAGPVVSMGSIERQANMMPWLQSTLVSAFAVIALCIALLGTYGVMSQMVASRQRDHAVRLAFGAVPAAIAASVLRTATAVTLPGVVIGVGVSWAVFDRVLRPILFGVDARAPWLGTSVGVGMLLLIVIASLPPALRAARVRVGADIGSS